MTSYEEAERVYRSMTIIAKRGLAEPDLAKWIEIGAAMHMRLIEPAGRSYRHTELGYRVLKVMRAETMGDLVQASRPCTMGVGCDEYGTCFAEAHGEPERCGRLYKLAGTT